VRHSSLKPQNASLSKMSIESSIRCFSLLLTSNLVIVFLVFWPRMDLQDQVADDQPADLLNDAGDVCEDALSPLPPLVPGPANPTKTMTNDEVYFALLYSEIKSCAIVPLSPKFQAMPCQEYRLFKLCLPKGFKASALAFFKLFFTD
jgi:hypothetical protein